ncbi:hypothetical protein [Vogesella urethralis]|uniref:hypothetical protein n=1 Tax=Vogesella urethralis TaxID=2592656 RepID=UPI001185E208|nr:hypothetical protein [Vogesella urethralis]
MEKKAIEYIFGFVTAPAVLIMAFFSGHLWIYVYFEFFAKLTKRKSMVDNNYGKISVGLIWFSFFLLPIVLYKYWGDWGAVNYAALEVLAPIVLVLGVFFQGLISIFVIYRGK